jgi:hypothetical protein
LSAYLSNKYLGSTAIGPFQNNIERKKTEINNANKPNVVSVELKDTKTRRIENTNIIPLRISYLDKWSNSTTPSLSLT